MTVLNWVVAGSLLALSVGVLIDMWTDSSFILDVCGFGTVVLFFGVALAWLASHKIYYLPRSGLLTVQRLYDLRSAKRSALTEGQSIDDVIDAYGWSALMNPHGFRLDLLQRQYELVAVEPPPRGKAIFEDKRTPPALLYGPTGGG
jgi:hypothetical protein